MSRKKLRPPYPEITMGSADALRKRPTLAAEIAVTIGVWSEIDQLWAITLAQMLNMSIYVGLAIFFGLRTDGPKKELIKIAAEKSLSPELN